MCWDRSNEDVTISILQAMNNKYSNNCNRIFAWRGIKSCKWNNSYWPLFIHSSSIAIWQMSHFHYKLLTLLYKEGWVTELGSLAPLVWHFCNKSDSDKLEKLQYRALRFVYDDYDSDYETLLSRANMQTLELHRQRALFIEVFKCIHKLAPPYLSELFTLRDKSIYNTRSAKALIQSHCESVDNGRKTFVNYSTYLWNNLPNHFKNTTDLDDFEMIRKIIPQMCGVFYKCFMTVINRLTMRLYKGPSRPGVVIGFVPEGKQLAEVWWC